MIGALVQTGKKAGYLAVGLLAESGFAKLSELLGKPELKQVIKVLGGVGLGVASSYVRNPDLKEVLQLAGAYNVVAGVKDILQQRQIMSFQEPVVEVVEVPEGQRKKPEFEILGSNRAQLEIF